MKNLEDIIIKNIHETRTNLFNAGYLRPETIYFTEMRLMIESEGLFDELNDPKKSSADYSLPLEKYITLLIDESVISHFLRLRLTNGRLHPDELQKWWSDLDQKIKMYYHEASKYRSLSVGTALSIQENALKTTIQWILRWNTSEHFRAVWGSGVIIPTAWLNEMWLSLPLMLSRTVEEILPLLQIGLGAKAVGALGWAYRNPPDFPRSQTSYKQLNQRY